VIKKNYYDECGGDCESCEKFSKKCFDNVPVLAKRKVHTKYVPPDMTALKLLFETREKSVDLEKMTDEELRSLEIQLREKLKI